jgi:ComF family protein
VAAVESLAHLSIRIVGHLLAPPTCAACDAPTSTRRIFCGPCASSVVETTPSIASSTFAAAEYGGAVATAIQRLKYQDRADLAEPLAHLLRASLRRRKPDADVVVPVPLHPRRLAERGYNQAVLLAREVADELEARPLLRALARTRYSAPQASLGKQERATNLRRAFAVRSPDDLRGARVALVDDVLTTGATFEACRAVLLEAGAQSVSAVVVAITPKHSSPESR